MKHILLAGSLAVLLAVLSLSCTKSDEYKKFLSSGPQTFPAKADSLKVFTGRYRVMLSWIIVSDPSVTKARIYWNNRADSMEVPIQKVTLPDTVKAVVSNLEEKPYTFEVFTFDKYGNRSVGVSASGRSLGERYEEALLDWGINMKIIIGAAPPYNSALVNWGAFYLDGLIGVRVTYTDKDGADQDVLVPADPVAAPPVVTSMFEKFVPGASFSYSTLYLPEATAIDTMHTAWQVVTP